MTFYHYSVCHVCKEHSPNLKRCSNCKVPYYCSREHQKKDWPSHKQLCKVIVACAQLEPPPVNPNAVEYNNFKMSQSASWSIVLDRDLNSYENDMWMYPKICAICYSQEASVVCEVCLSVAYCSEAHHDQHKQFHENFCQPLKLCLETEQNLFKMGQHFITDIKADFKEVQRLPETMEEVINSMGNKDYEPARFLQLTDLLSHVINIVYALEKSGFVENRQGKKEELVIHAARSGLRREFSVWFIIARFLSHWITNLRRVEIFWVRPNDTNRVMPFSCLGCTSCEAKKFSLRVSVFDGKYNDFIEKLPLPDLVVLFNVDNPAELQDNSCLEVRDDIPSLTFYKNVPALLTSFTKRDLDTALESLPSNVKYLVEPQLNNYRSLRPTRSFVEGFEPVTYHDHFVAIIAKE